MGLVRALAPLAVLLALAPAAAAEDFRVTLVHGQAPRFEGAAVEAELLEAGPGRVEWRLRSAAAWLEGTVLSEGWFEVERPRQVVPESRTPGALDDDWHFFHEVRDPGAPGPDRLVNLTGQGSAATLRLGFPVNGTAWLRLTRDVEPPGFTLGDPTNVTHFAFHLVTTTTEHALGDLRIRPAAGGEEVPHRTTILALLQRFPVQGLDPDTAYVFDVAFTDWAGNAATSPPVAVRTLPAPELPKPVVVERFPPPGAILGEPVALIAVAFTGPAPRPDGIAVFVDKLAVREGIALNGSRVEVRLAQPLGPGRHSVGVELTSAEGGTAVERWSFEVARPAPGPAGAALLLAAAAVLAVRRRGPPAR